jgi:mannosyltransferase OCH1-like enzyme
MEKSTTRNVNPLQQLYGSRRKPLRWIILAVATALVTIYLMSSSYAPSTTRLRSSKGKAKHLSPATLMERPISKDLQTIPKLIHQSWSSRDLPAKFERWSATCRKQHPDWEWVLWTDEDNEELVKKHFPWLLKTYKNLPGVIYRADLVRNLYMYMYGG